MKSPFKLKLALFFTGIALIAGAMFLPGSAIQTFAGPPLVVTGSPTVVVSVTPPPPGKYADPYVIKSTVTAQAVMSETIEFTLTAGNLGNADAVNVQVRDTLPPYLDLISVTASPRGTVIQSGNSFIVDIGTLAPTDLITIKVTTRVNTQAQPGICANVATLNTTSDGDNPNNNVSLATCVIGQIIIPPDGGSIDDGQSVALPFLMITLGALLIIASLFIRQRKTT
jgi:uncharacterized repeat protein (TIGR01451 family)